MRPTLRWLGTAHIHRPRLDRPGTLLVALASLAYIAIGLPDGMLGVAWPSISGEFGVPLSSLGILITALTIGYGLASFASGRILQSTGAGTMVTVSAALMALGLFGYAAAAEWWMLLGCAALAGMAAGGIDGAMNIYAALHFSARSTNWMHGFYALGAAAGPAIMTGFLVSGARWQLGFATAAAASLALATAFALTRSRWNLGDGQAADDGQGPPVERAIATLRLPAAWVGIAMFALYTGLEVTAGQWMFTLLTEGRGLSTGTAGTWVSMFFLGLMGGRIGLGMLTSLVPVQQLLRYCMAASVLAAALIWLDLASWITFTGIFVMGLSFGPVFPSLIFTTPARTGRSHAPNAIGFQISAAAAGAALMPIAVGLVADATTLEAISVSMLAGATALLGLYEATERLAARGH